MDECERLEAVLAIIDEISAKAQEGAVILVEGRRDREALVSLGIQGEIIMTSQRPLFNLAETLALDKREVVILTDWDARGDEVATQAEAFMKADGLKPDTVLRKALKVLVRKEIKDVESLYMYVERLKKTCSAKPQHY